MFADIRVECFSYLQAVREVKLGRNPNKINERKKSVKCIIVKHGNNVLNRRLIALHVQLGIRFFSSKKKVVVK